MKFSENSISELNSMPTEKQNDLSFIKFPAGNILVVDTKDGELKLLNKNRVLQLVIQVKDEGLTVNVNAYHLNVDATDQLNLSAKKVNIIASDQINFKTQGNLVQQVDKDILTEAGGTNKMIAQVQKITASLGNVEIKANDDVRLDGERVLLNCD